MSKKIIPVTDEMLNDLPSLRRYIARRLWYSYYRHKRIEEREFFNRLVKGDGHHKPGLKGILNLPGVNYKERRKNGK